MPENRTMLVNLVLRGRVTTTASKARQLSSQADQLLHLARHSATLRQLIAILDHEYAAQHLVTSVVPRLSRPTVRRRKRGFRKGDGASLVTVSFDLMTKQPETETDGRTDHR